MKDNEKLFVALVESNLLASHAHVMYIMTGVHTVSSVNVEKARAVGHSILDSDRKISCKIFIQKK